MNTPYQGDGPLILSHRGGGNEAVENSWASLEHMRAHGLTVMETDVRATADGVPVLHHDETLERLCGRPEALRSLTVAQLAEIHDHSGNPLVTLDEAMHSFPEMRFNLDAKEEAVVGPLAERALKEPDRVTLASFSSARLAQLSQVAPGAFRSLGMSEVARFRLLAAFSVGAVRALFPVQPGVYALQIPEHYGALRVTTPRLIEAAHQLGLEIHVWTVDDIDVAERLISEGVDGIVTDTPARLSAHFASKGPVRK